MAFSEQQHQQSIDAIRKKKLAEHRAKTGTAWLIREDGMLFPNVPLAYSKNNKLRPYHGDVHATLEQRMQYLQGLSHGRRRVVMSAPVDEEPFDIAKASKPELIEFAMDEYATEIDPDEHLNKVRAIVAKLAGVDLVAAQRPSGEGAPVQRARKAEGASAGGLT